MLNVKHVQIKTFLKTFGMVFKLFGFFLLLNSNHLNAQVTLSGKVTDSEDNTPLLGASVLIEDTNLGTTTDINGIYSMKLINGDYKIKFSYIGYESTFKIVKINSLPVTLNISLKQTSVAMNEVLVTAKTEARKIREQAMPIAVISMQELQGTVSDVSEVLSKTAGVKIRSSGGVGSSSRISVRGLEGKRIGFFIDETPLSDNTDFLDINDIPIDLIDRVEIYKGIVPAKFGGSAIGGAVNLGLKEYPPQYLDASYSVASFNTHKASTIFKLNKDGIEAGIGGFFTYADNDYEMELPLQPGKHVVRDHDNFQKLVIGGGLTSKKWWFDEVVFEPAMIFSEKEIQGIEYNIQEAKSYAEAYAFSNHLEKTNIFTEGLDLDINNTFAYTVFRFEDKAMNKYTWDNELRPPATRLGGEIGVHPNDTYNQKYTFLQRTNLNYLLDECNSLNFSSQYNYARGIPSDPLKDEIVGYKTNFNSSMNSWISGLTYEYNSLNKKLTNALTAKYYFYSMDTKYVDLYGVNTTPENIDMKKKRFWN